MGARSEKGVFVRIADGVRAFFSAILRFFVMAASAAIRHTGRGPRRLASPPAGPRIADAGAGALLAKEPDAPLAPLLSGGLGPAFPEADLDSFESTGLLPGAGDLSGGLQEAEGRGSEIEWLLGAEAPGAVVRGGPNVLRLSLDPEQGAEGELPAASRLVNRILVGAVARGASHVLIRPIETSLEVSYLVGGVLMAEMHPSLELRDRIAHEIKALAELDTGLSRVPQSGSVKLVTDLWERHCGVRILPTRLGEQIGLSLTDKILH